LPALCGFSLGSLDPFMFEARLPFGLAPARETLPSPSVADTRASPVIPTAAPRLSRIVTGPRNSRKKSRKTEKDSQGNEWEINSE
jgi:hypothetical protein